MNLCPTVPPNWNGTLQRSEAEQMLEGYADALLADAGVSANSIRDFVEPRYASDHSFYLLIVPMLSRCFPTVSPAAVKELALAFYGIFRMVLAMDRVADRNEPACLFDGLVHYTVSLRRLSAVFPPDSKIWSGLTERIRFSIDQIRQERELRQLEGRNMDAFVSVAKGKSSLIQLPVDWLEAIQPVGGLADRIRTSLLEKHVGMQWLDDINDFASDVEQGQPTWARFMLESYAKARDLDIAVLSSRQQKRLMFATGLGEEILDDACGHFAAALAELGEVELPEYANVIESYISKIREISLALSDERVAANARLSEKNFRATAESR